MTTPSSTMWGGRFSEATDAFVAEFTASVNFDKRLYKHDIQGSMRSCHHAGKSRRI
jgi:argininosuccinate lyase